MFRGLTLRRTARSWPLHSRGGAGDDRGDSFPAGGRARRPGRAAVVAGPAGPQVHGRGADGDVDRGEGGGVSRAAVLAVEVPGGGAFDLAGAEPGLVPGRVSTAVTIAIRSSWQSVSRAQVS